MFCPIKLTRFGEPHQRVQGSNLQLLFNRKMFEKELLYVSFGSAVRTGFEPVNSTVTGWHDNQLHQRTIRMSFPFYFCYLLYKT